MRLQIHQHPPVIFGIPGTVHIRINRKIPVAKLGQPGCLVNEDSQKSRRARRSNHKPKPVQVRRPIHHERPRPPPRFDKTIRHQPVERLLDRDRGRLKLARQLQPGRQATPRRFRTRPDLAG